MCGTPPMTAYRLSATTQKDAAIVGQTGGIPHLPAAEDWPRCRMCASDMIAFLDLVLPTCDSAPFQPGSRLQIFACRQHDDIAGTIYSNYSRFDLARRQPTLPAEYWSMTDGHYVLRLLPPSTPTSESRSESRLVPQLLSATPTDDDGEDGFKMYGEPCWLQDAEPHACACGAPMKLLLQIPAGHRFPMAVGAEPQPNSFSQSDYCLFLGNQLYLLGCTRQCEPRALWPVLQD